MQEIKHFVEKWLRQAGGLLTAMLQEEFAREHKADASPVTAIDRAVERLLRSLITSQFPDHGIIGEELPPYKAEASTRWVIDPVDGTRALLGGFPTYTIMLALVENDKPIVSGILQPVTRELWVGDGSETTLNGKAVRCRTQLQSLAEAHFSTTSPHLVKAEDQPMIERMMKEASLCLLGGDGYAYGKLASGTVDAIVESGMKAHDFLPLIPIIHGAGGIVSDWQGEPLHAKSNGDVVAAGSSALHEELLKRISDHGE